MKIATIIMWIIYSCIEGRRDGFLYHYRNTSSAPKNENIHWIYFIDRLFILTLLFILDYFGNRSYLNTGIFITSLALLFSFLHNGMYYHTRNQLDEKVYPDGWWSSSVSSEATLEFNVLARIILAIIGISGIIASFTF